MRHRRVHAPCQQRAGHRDPEQGYLLQGSLREATRLQRKQKRSEKQKVSVSELRALGVTSPWERGPGQGGRGGAADKEQSEKPGGACPAHHEQTAWGTFLDAWTTHDFSGSFLSFVFIPETTSSTNHIHRESSGTL